MSTSKYIFSDSIKKITESFLSDIGVVGTFDSGSLGNRIILTFPDLDAAIRNRNTNEDKSVMATSIFFDLVRYSQDDFKPIDDNDSRNFDLSKQRMAQSIAIARQTYGKSCQYFDTVATLFKRLLEFINEDSGETLRTENSEISDVVEDIEKFSENAGKTLRRFIGNKISVYDVGSGDHAGKEAMISDTKMSLINTFKIFEEKADDGVYKFYKLGRDSEYDGMLNWLSTYNSYLIGNICANMSSAIAMYITGKPVDEEDKTNRALLVRNIRRALPDGKASTNIQAFKIFLETLDEQSDRLPKWAKTEEKKDGGVEGAVEEVSDEDDLPHPDVDPDETPEEKTEREEAEERTVFAELNNMYNTNDDESKDAVADCLKSSGMGMLVYRRIPSARTRTKMEHGKSVRMDSIYDTSDAYVAMIPANASISFFEDGAQETPKQFGMTLGDKMDD